MREHHLQTWDGAVARHQKNYMCRRFMPHTLIRTHSVRLENHNQQTGDHTRPRRGASSGQRGATGRGGRDQLPQSGRDRLTKAAVIIHATLHINLTAVKYVGTRAGDTFSEKNLAINISSCNVQHMSEPRPQHQRVQHAETEEGEVLSLAASLCTHIKDGSETENFLILLTIYDSRQPQLCWTTSGKSFCPQTI